MGRGACEASSVLAMKRMRDRFLEACSHALGKNFGEGKTPPKRRGPTLRDGGDDIEIDELVLGCASELFSQEPGCVFSSSVFREPDELAGQEAVVAHAVPLVDSFQLD